MTNSCFKDLDDKKCKGSGKCKKSHDCNFNYHIYFKKSTVMNNKGELFSVENSNLQYIYDNIDNVESIWLKGKLPDYYTVDIIDDPNNPPKIERFNNIPDLNNYIKYSREYIDKYSVDRNIDRFDLDSLIVKNIADDFMDNNKIKEADKYYRYLESNLSVDKGNDLEYLVEVKYQRMLTLRLLGEKESSKLKFKEAKDLNYLLMKNQYLMDLVN